MIDDNSFNDFDFYLNGIVTEKEQLPTINRLKDELDVMIRDMTWQNLVVTENSKQGSIKSYKIGFDARIKNKIEEIQQIYQNLNHLNVVGHEILFRGDHLHMECSIQVNTLSNRIDIVGEGIPRSIRGLGLGCKIYRAILDHEEYLTSKEEGLFGNGKILWNSLRRNPLFYTFYYNTRAFCFAADKNPQEIIQILEDQINHHIITNILWDNDFVREYRPLIEQSNLRSLLP
ncbi:hypothetical protein [Flavobacterium hungaricum]|uniref:GNAT family N-acetyltransferase n=1 Tax=Flavobacterium hungaricum TaxID=2082725 RepID=A0ABR9TFC7_9FLAO|nr:hypothetical protein [Flavobacterium hungaricum]MBE8723382.1 hypothetical protein [Flavobacterium hungaricum]